MVRPPFLVLDQILCLKQLYPVGQIKHNMIPGRFSGIIPDNFSIRDSTKFLDKSF